MNKNLYFNIKNISKYINKIYIWMSFGLLITWFISWYIIKIPFILEIIFLNKLFLLTLLTTQSLTIFLISNLINKIDINTIILIYIIHSILTGISISSIFLIYTYSSIIISILICNIIFFIMSFIGYKLENDLTKIGNISLILIIGTIISTIFNIVLKSSFITFITSYINILSFYILIIWDTNKFKEIGKYIIENNNYKKIKKYSILGGLILYLNFINLYLLILKLSGNKIIK